MHLYGRMKFVFFAGVLLSLGSAHSADHGIGHSANKSVEPNNTSVRADEERAKVQREWPEWSDFTRRFMQKDGRIIDVTFDQKSTSEGQSYAMFFALVANQPAQFETIYKWTNDNLAGGQLGDKLPAWLWGKRDDGSWGIKDQNSASDADLWLAYDLLEAGRLWSVPRYTSIGLKLLQEIRQREIVQAGRAGLVLLPAPFGFELENKRYRINPSYLPGFIFRYFATVDAKGPWQTVWNSYMNLTTKAFSSGAAPDLFVVDANGTVTQDSQQAPIGSYDAIRVYLWAGMSGRDSETLLKQLTPFAATIRKYQAPPEKMNPATGLPTRTEFSPVGFSGAVLPFLHSLGDKTLLQQQRERIEQTVRSTKAGDAVNYYDQALVLFGKGWLDGKYRFDDAGRLQPDWLH